MIISKEPLFVAPKDKNSNLKKSTRIAEDDKKSTDRNIKYSESELNTPLKNNNSIMNEILELLNISMSYGYYKSSIENYIKKSNNDYQTLYLTVASSTLNYKYKNYVITPNGINYSSRNENDGIVLFGYKDKINDFIFPCNSSDNNEYPIFCIYFSLLDKSYYIKNFNTGLGALTKINKIKLDNNNLINIGSSYLVICIEKFPEISIKIFNNLILENINICNNVGSCSNCQTKKFVLNQKLPQSFTIGRNTLCDIVIEDMMLSKIQCIIEYDPCSKSLFLIDGNSKKESTNGTWMYILNSIKITDNFLFKAEHSLFNIKINNNK